MGLPGRSLRLMIAWPWGSVIEEQGCHDVGYWLRADWVTYMVRSQVCVYISVSESGFTV